MAGVAIKIQTLIPGKQHDLTENDLVLHLMEERLTAAVLIQLTVEERMQKLATHQRQTPLSTDKGASASFTATSQWHTAAEESGVLFPSRYMQEPLLQTEIEKAQRAFELGHYLLLVNKHRVKSLDEEILLSPGTQVQFLRLLPLVGG
jgi:hypothetical protein